MTDSKAYTLFVLGENPYFENGTLFELEKKPGASGFLLPDKGNGEEGMLQPSDLFACPEFSQNIPPSICMVKITSGYVTTTNNDSNAKTIHLSDFSEVTVFKNIHFQQVRLSFIKDFPKPEQVILTDKLKGFELYNIEHPALEEIDNRPVLCIEISHIAPGFYKLTIKTGFDFMITITFIKFFPEYLKELYPVFVKQRDAALEKEKIKLEKSTGLSLDEHLKLDDKTNAVTKAFGTHPVTAGMMNAAIKLVTEWGENYQKPIDVRLLREYPGLKKEEIAALTIAAREAESFIYNTCELELDGKIMEGDIYNIVKKKYPWMEDEVIMRLKSIGMFYARK